MGKITGFKEFDRETAPYRDVTERLKDFGEIFASLMTAALLIT